MKLKGVNASSERTIKLIKKTFAELMAEKKEINAITITELVKRAGLTRGAFYSHYDNIYEVANDFQEEILSQVIGNDFTISSIQDMNNYFDELFLYLKNNQDIYSKLLSSKDAIYFMERLNNKICHTLTKAINNPKKNLSIIFFTDATMNLVIRFFKKEISEDLDDISSFVKKIGYLLFFN